MFKFEDFARVATAAVGALVLTTMTVAAAVTPAHTAAQPQQGLAAVQSGTVAHG